MLIIGDLAIQKYKPDHKVVTKEVIFQDDYELSFIKKKYKLDQLIISTPTKVIFKKAGVIHKLYSLNGLGKGGNDIMSHNFAWKFREKIADPFTTYLFEAIRIKYRPDDFIKWEDKMEAFIYLQNKFVAPLIAYNRDFETKLESFYSKLISFTSQQTDLKSYPYVYKKLEVKLEFKDMLELVSKKRSYQSSYYKILPNFNKDGLGPRSEVLFNALNDDDKLSAAMESLYVDTLSQYVLPYLKEYGTDISDVELFLSFKKSIMNKISQESNVWFSLFLLHNYDLLEAAYTTEFYEKLTDSLFSKHYILGKELNFM